MEQEFPLEYSVRENRTTFSDVPSFPEIFHSDGSKSRGRVPFTFQPKIYGNFLKMVNDQYFKQKLLPCCTVNHTMQAVASALEQSMCRANDKHCLTFHFTLTSLKLWPHNKNNFFLSTES